MNYNEHILKFRNWQMENDERVFEIPMSEEEFNRWILPTKETDFTRAEKLSYKEIYLRLKKLFAGNEPLLAQLEETAKPILENQELI